jgi:hypothetical protein
VLPCATGKFGRHVCNLNSTTAPNDLICVESLGDIKPFSNAFQSVHRYLFGHEPGSQPTYDGFYSVSSECVDHGHKCEYKPMNTPETESWLQWQRLYNYCSDGTKTLSIYVSVIIRCVNSSNTVFEDVLKLIAPCKDVVPSTHFKYRGSCKGRWIFVANNCSSLYVGTFELTACLLTIGSPSFWVVSSTIDKKTHQTYYFCQSGDVLYIPGGTTRHVVGYALGPTFVFLSMLLCEHTCLKVIFRIIHLKKREPPQNLCCPASNRDTLVIEDYMSEYKNPYMDSPAMIINSASYLTHLIAFAIKRVKIEATSENVSSLCEVVQLVLKVWCTHYTSSPNLYDVYPKYDNIPDRVWLQKHTRDVVDCHFLYLNLPSGCCHINLELENHGSLFQLYEWGGVTSNRIPGYARMSPRSLLLIAVKTHYDLDCSPKRFSNLFPPSKALVKAISEVPTSDNGICFDDYFNLHQRETFKLGQILMPAHRTAETMTRSRPEVMTRSSTRRTAKTMTRSSTRRTAKTMTRSSTKIMTRNRTFRTAKVN